MPDYFDWGALGKGNESKQSREENMISLWTRPTIFYSLECEDKLSREDAYDSLGKKIEVLAFFQQFWWIGSFIIMLVIIPAFFLDA